MTITGTPNSTQQSVVDIAYDDLIVDINYWQTKVQTNDDIYDLAFFKIFVKFEGYLIAVFKEYICGMGSANYTPECKIRFDDINHFERLVKSNSKGTFIDYLNLMENFAKEVFENNKNPFDCIFADAELKELYQKMRYLRNHIAHESSESKLKYHKNVLNNQGFIEPNEHLKKVLRRTRNTYFTEYVLAIEKSALILRNPSSFF